MNDAHRVIVILEEPKRNPYEVWLLAALFLSALLSLIGATPESNAMVRALPRFSLLLWYIQVFTGTAVALIGIYWKQPTLGRTIQIAGHLWVGSGAFIYACVLFYYNGPPATMNVLIVASVTLAALIKVFQLRRQIRQILQKVKEQNGAGDLSAVNGGE